MAISDAIQDLKDRVLSAYDACEEKGAALPDVKNTANLPDCIRSISGGSSNPSYETVRKEVEFCKSKLISEGGKGSCAGAWICLRYSGVDYEDFALSSSNVVAVRTSDGAFYSYEDDGANVTHHWDSSKDFDIEGIDIGQKFNWVIYYYSANSIASNSSYLDCAKAVNIIYVFDMDLKLVSVTSGSTYNAYGLSRYNTVLQSFDSVNGHTCTGESENSFAYLFHSCKALVALPDNLDTSQGTTFHGFCYSCACLVSLPDNIDTSQGTDFTDFCRECYSLVRFPDNLDTGKGQNFELFAAYCAQLIELPENLNTSNGTSFIYFCLGCRRLSKLPDNLNTSKGTEFRGFCSNCLALTKLPNVLDTGRCSYLTSLCDDCVALTKAKIILRYDANLTTIDASGKLTVESMRFIADRAPFLYTGKRTITFGAANLARANKYDPTILSTLDLKGWIVN